MAVALDGGGVHEHKHAVRAEFAGKDGAGLLALLGDEVEGAAPQCRCALANGYQFLHPSAQVGVPLILLPREGAAVVGVFAACDADFVAVVNCRRTEVGKLDCKREFYLFGRAEFGEDARRVVTSERQVHGKGVFGRVDGRKFQQAVVKVACRQVAVEEGDDGVAQGVVHQPVKVPHPARVGSPNFAHEVGVGVFGFDHAAKFLPKFIIVNFVGHI